MPICTLRQPPSARDNLLKENVAHGCIHVTGNTVIDALVEIRKRLGGFQDDQSEIEPVHRNPNVRMPVREALGSHPRIKLLEPLDYLPFIALMDACYLILTDSGGVQEEAPALGKLVLVLRDTTERPEGIEAGNARLVGVSAERIIAEAALLLDDPVKYRMMSQSRNPYGDGKAAARIAKHIVGSTSH